MFAFLAKTSAKGQGPFGCSRTFLPQFIRKNNTFAVTTCAAVFLQALWLAPLSAESSDRPNIVFILVDDMGYGDPCCYNNQSKIPTSNIDSLAASGLRFTDAHAAGPLCHMSRYGLLTGRYPFRKNVSLWPKQPLIGSDQATFASVLKGQGYRTHMVGKWHCGFKEDGYDKPLPGGPIDVGFDTFFGIRASTDIPPYFYIRGNKAVQPPTDKINANYSEGWSQIQGAFWRAGGIAPDLKLANVLPRFTEEAMKVIEDHPPGNEPMLLYLAYPAPHTPWLPAQEYIGKSKASMYGDFMVMVDAMIGRVLDSLESKGLADDTLVIFSSDNGPTWYEEDVRRFDHDSSGGLRGMKADAWEGGHRVPLIVRWPGKVKAGSVSSRLISFVDVLATFADITGAKLDPPAGPDSISFAAELTNATSSVAARDHLALQSGAGHMTFREGDWKLIDALGSGGFTKPSRIQPRPGDPQGQLYNLATDPSEQQNVYAKYPEIVDRLTKRLKQLHIAGRSH